MKSFAIHAPARIGTFRFSRVIESYRTSEAWAFRGEIPGVYLETIVLVPGCVSFLSELEIRATPTLLSLSVYAYVSRQRTIEERISRHTVHGVSIAYYQIATVYSAAEKQVKKRSSELNSESCENNSFENSLSIEYFFVSRRLFFVVLIVDSLLFCN